MGPERKRYKTYILRFTWRNRSSKHSNHWHDNLMVKRLDRVIKETLLPSGQLGLSQVPCSTDSPSQGPPPNFEADFTVRLLCRVPRAGDVAGWQDSEHVPQAAQLSQRQGWGHGPAAHSCSTSSKATPPLVGQTSSPGVEGKLPFSHRRLLRLVPPPQEWEQLDHGVQADTTGGIGQKTSVPSSPVQSSLSISSPWHMSASDGFWHTLCLVFCPGRPAG